MNPTELRRLLEAVQNGSLKAHVAHKRLLEYLRQNQFEDLGFARIDHNRAMRQGFPEVIFGSGKTPQQVASIAKRIVETGDTLLVTRADEATYAAVRAVVPDAIFQSGARLITFQQGSPPPGRGVILIITAGTSDLSVAEEAAFTAELMGNKVDRLYDVGVAGIHRLLTEQNRLGTARVIIAIAGMEGALPSVVGGLVSVPVIAVPSSVGYGASFGGLTALLAMLNSCATGISVVNIDNGFGAAAIASLINHLE